jgi:ATP-dependent DNA helicase RecQ
MRASSAWYERSQRVGWDIVYTPLGGRLRSEKNLTVDNLSDESLKRLRSQSMIAVSPAKGETIDSNVIFFCSIARKILQRGELPPVPTEIERVSLELFRPLESFTKDEISATAIGIRKSIVLDAETKFESTYEKAFWEFANINYPDISAYLISQAPMHCLVATSKQEHWADFLLFGPWNADDPKVIEIDGSQHESEKSQDDQRDNFLRKLKIETSRIKGNKWQVAAEMGFKSNSQMLPQTPFSIERARSLFGPSIPTRLGVGLIELLVRGHFPARADLELVLDDDLGIADKLLIPTLNFLHHIESLWGIEVLPRSISFDNSTYAITAKGYVAERLKALKTIKIALSLQQYVTPQAALKIGKFPQCVIRGAFLPLNLTFLPLLAANTRKLINPGEQEIFHLTQLMNGLFGHESFRENQSEAILTTLSGEDSLVLLPTGSGKSLIYQLIGLLQPGTTLVVDPLTALIKDQIRRLDEEGIDRTLGMHTAALNTSTRKVGAFADIAEGQALFIFLSPERLHNKEFRSAMHAFAANHVVNSAVLDEAHCISEWGHDFRTAYLNVARNLRRICSNDAPSAPTLLALTGTASPAVLRDVIREIKDINKDIKLIKPSTYDRKNLNYLIDIGDLSQSKERLSTLLLETIPKYFEITAEDLIACKGKETNSGIVFVATRNPK